MHADIFASFLSMLPFAMLLGYVATAATCQALRLTPRHSVRIRFERIPRSVFHVPRSRHDQDTAQLFR